MVPVGLGLSAPNLVKYLVVTFLIELETSEAHWNLKCWVEQLGSYGLS